MTSSRARALARGCHPSSAVAAVHRVEPIDGRLVVWVAERRPDRGAGLQHRTANRPLRHVCGERTTMAPDGPDGRYAPFARAAARVRAQPAPSSAAARALSRSAQRGSLSEILADTCKAGVAPCPRRRLRRRCLATKGAVCSQPADSRRPLELDEDRRRTRHRCVRRPRSAGRACGGTHGAVNGAPRRIRARPNAGEAPA